MYQQQPLTTGIQQPYLYDYQQPIYIHSYCQHGAESGIYEHFRLEAYKERTAVLERIATALEKLLPVAKNAASSYRKDVADKLASDG